VGLGGATPSSGPGGLVARHDRGDLAGGILGDTYEVSTTGGSLAFAVNTGRMAGESVLHYLGK